MILYSIKNEDFELFRELLSIDINKKINTSNIDDDIVRLIGKFANINFLNDIEDVSKTGISFTKKELVIGFILGNHLELFSEYLDDGYLSDDADILYYLAKGGYFELIKKYYVQDNLYSIDINFNKILYGAATSNHLEIIDWILNESTHSKYAKNFGKKSIVKGALEGGNLLLAKRYIPSVTIESIYDDCLLLDAAIFGGNIDCIEWIILKFKNNDKDIIFIHRRIINLSAKYDKLNVFKYVINRYENLFEYGLEQAVYEGNINIAIWIFSNYDISDLQITRLIQLIVKNDDKCMIKLLKLQFGDRKLANKINPFK